MLWTRQNVLLSVHCNSDIGDITKFIGHNEPMRDEYQLCKVTSKANIPVKSWSSGINFGNVCDLDIEVRTNPHAMDNNHVRNSSNLNHWISNSKYNPNWDLNPGLFCFKKCCTIQLFACFVFDSKNWQNFDFVYNKISTLTLTLALGLSYDTPFGHGQQLCEASSASKLAEFE